MRTNNDKSFLDICQLKVPKSSFTKAQKSTFIRNVRSLTKKHSKNFNEHASFTDRYIVSNPSHATLAHQSDCHPRTTIRFQKVAEELDIYKFIRTKYQTNIIIANPIMFDVEVRIILQKEYPAFRSLPLVKPLIKSKNVTLINTKNINNKLLNLHKVLKEESNSMIELIRTRLNLGNYQITQIEKYDEKVLAESYSIYLKSTNIKDPYAYFLGTCRQVEARINKLKVPTEQNVVSNFKPSVPKKKVKYYEPKVETPEQAKVREETHKRAISHVLAYLEEMNKEDLEKDNIPQRCKSQENETRSSQVKLDPIGIESNSLDNDDNQYFIL